jgi:hypothetical protein
MNPIFKGHVVQEDLDFLILEDGTDSLSQNIGTELPVDAV